jgi:hypothetical protein
MTYYLPGPILQQASSMLSYNSTYVLFDRAIYEASLSSKPEIAYLTEAIGHASDIQVQNSFQIKVLQNESKIKTCRDFEEEEGRINTDLLSRLIIVGGPLIQPGPSMQDQLVKQVWICQFVPFHVIIFGQLFPPHFNSIRNKLRSDSFVIPTLYASFMDRSKAYLSGVIVRPG